MNDDELDRRLADYGATLDRAAAEAASAREAGAPTVALDEAASRRRRSVVWAAATVAALVAATVGVVVVATRGDGDVTVSDAGTSVAVAPPSTDAATVTTTTTVDPPSAASPGSDPITLPTRGTADASTTTSTQRADATVVACDAPAISADTGVELAALMGGCHGGWALGVTPACASVTEGECESAEAFAASPTGWRAAGPVYPFCVEPLVEATGMTARTAAAFGAQACDPATSLDLEAPPATLRPGDSSPEVRALQIALIVEGYRIVDDGTYGPATETAVREFQSREVLPVDGVAGPATRAALEV